MAPDDPGPARLRTGPLRRLALPTALQLVIILAFMVVGVGVAYGGLKLQSKHYRSTALIFVTATKVEAANGLQTTNTYLQSRMQTYIQFATTPTVLEEVKSDLSTSKSTATLAGQISADAPINSTLLYVRGTDTSARGAQRITQSAATRLSSYIVLQETPVGARLSTAVASVKTSFVHPATLPKAPQSAPRNLVLFIGLLAGFVLGALAVVVWELTNKRIRRPRDLESMDDAPLVGLIPHNRRADGQVHVFAPGGSKAAAEAYRQLRTNLVFGDIDSARRVIAITSPTGGEGKTTTAVNLAASLVELGLSVCVVECDLRNPSFVERFSLDTETGLSTHLRDLATLQSVTYDSGEGFSVVPAGPATANPSQLLGAQRLGTAFAELATRFDYVLVDTSALLPFAGGAEAVLVADVSFVVVRAKESRRGPFERAVSGLVRTGRYGGVILNDGRGKVHPEETGMPSHGAVAPTVVEERAPESSGPARRRRGRVADEGATIPSTVGARRN